MKKVFYAALISASFSAGPLFAGNQEDFLAAVKRDNLKLAQKVFAKGDVNVNLADDKGKSPVQYSCENGNAAAFTWLAEQQADLSSKDGEGNSCIHLAVKARKPGPLIAAAIEKGQNKNAVNAKGETPLILAVALGKKPAADELIKNQVDLNLKDQEGHSALSRSIAVRRQDLALALIQAGAQANSDSNAPLNLAYDLNQYKVFDALVKAGANVNITHEKSGQTLLVEMVKKEKTAYAKLLIESNANVNIADGEGNSLIALVVKGTIPDLVPPLIQRGIAIESKDASGKTLLQIAHENILKRLTGAREKLFKVLLEAGANPSTLSAANRTLLMEQSESGRYNQVKVLLDSGADFNFRDKTGNTVLHTTAQRNQLGTMRLIAEKFTDINLTGDSGNTATHFAARAGGTGILKLLKDRGANLELKNNAGDTALSIAIGRQDPATTKALLGLGASLGDEGRETPLMMEIAKSGAVNARTTELLTVLKKAGANINAANRYGNNALAYSLNRKNIKMADSFLKAGAESEAKDSLGNTMLHKLAMSARYNRLKNQELAEWINLVLSYQSSDFQNNAGETPLHIAAMKDNNPDVEGAYQFFEEAVNFGANVTLRDAAGRSVFDVARKMDWEAIAGANLPAGPATQNIAQVFVTPEPDKLIKLSSADRDFYAVAELGPATTRLIRFNDEMGVKSAKDFPQIQAMIATGDGVLIAGVRPGDIDGAPDKKCREGKNLVVYVAMLDSSLNPRWENTWGKAGSCQRSTALAVGYDTKGNTLLYADFSGRRSIRKLNGSGALETAEINRNDRVSEFAFLPDGTVALTGQNLFFNADDGKNLGKLSKSRGIKMLALTPGGARYFVGDFYKLALRRGLSLNFEDAEGKIVWSKNFASDHNLTLENITAGDDRICMTGKTDNVMHGQAHSTPEKATDYYVLCTTAQGTRVYTRLIPAPNMKLVEFRLNRRGVCVLIFQTADRKNPDLIIYRIDREGRVFN